MMSLTKSRKYHGTRKPEIVFRKTYTKKDGGKY